MAFCKEHIITMKGSLAPGWEPGSRWDGQFGVLSYEVTPPSISQMNGQTSISVVIDVDDTRRPDERYEGQFVIDTVLDWIVLPFADPDSIRINQVPRECSDPNIGLVFFTGETGRVTIDYEVDWERANAACGATWSIFWRGKTYKSRDDYVDWGFRYCMPFMKDDRDKDPCEELLLALGGTTSVDGTVTLTLDDGSQVAYKGIEFCVDPASLGWGWSMTHDQRIEVLEDESLVYRNGPAPFLRWTRVADSYHPDRPDNYVEVQRHGDGLFRLILPDQSEYHFHDLNGAVNHGRLHKMIDRNGNALTYDYEPGGGHPASIRDDKGRVTFLVHGSDGQPTAIREKRGTFERETRFDYYLDGPNKGRLRYLTNPVGDRTEFRYYDDGGQMWQVINRRNSVDVVDIEYVYYPNNHPHAGKVWTETFTIDPATGKGQRRHTYTYNKELRETVVLAEDLTKFATESPESATRTHRFLRNERNQVVEVVDPLGNRFFRKYQDPLNPYLMTEFTTPNGTTRYTYNRQGNVASVEDVQGNLTEIKYYEDLYEPTDPNFNKKHRNLAYEVHRPLVTVLESGQPIKKKFPPIRFRYDDSGNLERVIQMLGDQELETVFEHREDGLLRSTTDRNGFVTTFDYWPSGNLRSVTTPGTPGAAPALTTTFDYDPLDLDRLDRVHLPKGHGVPDRIWRHEFDDLDRLKAITDPRPEGFKTEFLYQDGQLARLEAPPCHGGGQAARVTEYRYDLGARLERMLSDVDGALPQDRQMRARFEYDGFANLRSLVRLMKGQENKTSYGVDVLDRPTSMTDPLQRTSTLAHDAFCGHVTRQTARDRVRNTKTDTWFDTLCRVKEVHNQEGETRYEYDEWNRLVSVTEPGGASALYGTATLGQSRYGDQATELQTRRYTYDELNRLVLQEFPDGKTIQYGYDPEGRLRSMIDVHGRRTTYTYYHDGRLRTVTCEGQEFLYLYDTGGRLKELRYPLSTDIVCHYSWDEASHLKEMRYQRGTVTLHKMEYWYDASGNRSHFRDTPLDISRRAEWEYRYDGLNRLRAAYKDQVLVTSYHFDESDNRVEMDKRIDGVLTKHVYQYDAADQIINVDRDGLTVLAFQHDEDGNVLERRDLHKNCRDTFMWNSNGRLTSLHTDASGESQSALENHYNLNEFRIKRSGSDGASTRYYHTGFPVVAETQKSVGDIQDQASLIRGHQLLGILAAETRLFIVDLSGSVRCVVETSGNLVQEYAYEEFAEAGDGTQVYQMNRGYLGAAGGIHETEDLYLLGYRHYSATLGRFLSRDPLNAELNPYAYSQNDPINRTDPLGLASIVILYGPSYPGALYWDSSTNPFRQEMEAAGNTVTIQKLTSASLRSALKNGDIVIINAHGVFGKGDDFKALRGFENISADTIEKLLRENPKKNQALFMVSCASLANNVIGRFTSAIAGQPRVVVGLDKPGAPSFAIYDLIRDMIKSPDSSVGDLADKYEDAFAGPNSFAMLKVIGKSSITWKDFSP